MASPRRQFLVNLGWGALAALASPRGHGADSSDDRDVNVLLTGDVMTGRAIDQILAHPGDPILYESYLRSAIDYLSLAEDKVGPMPRKVAPEYIWGDALQRFATASVRIVNLETAVTTSGDHWPGKSVHYRMHPKNVGCLTAAGIDCCVLSNNHALDWGREGLLETLATLEAAGIRVAGAGRDRAAAAAPAVLPLAGGGRVLVFGIGEPGSGIPRDWAATKDQPGVHLVSELSAESAQELAGYVNRFRRPGDIVVVSVHWGGNWGYRVPDAQALFARRLIDQARVDVVHGHSSHHPKGLQVYQGRLILYGCGDLINDYEGIGGRRSFRPELCLLYQARFDRSGGGLRSLSMLPLRVERFRLNRAGDDEAGWLQRRMDRESQGYGTRIELSREGALVARYTRF